MSKAYWLSNSRWGKKSKGKEKNFEIDLILLNKSNRTSSTLNDGMVQQRRGTHNYLITDHHRGTDT